MIRTPRFFSPSVLIGLAGGLGIAFLIGHLLTSGIPEVGLLEPVAAAPAERLEQLKLRRGQTFGEILSNASIGWSDQNSLLMAFREQANPRRMRDESRITLRWLPGENVLRGVDVALNKDETVRLLRDGTGWTSDLIQTPIWVDTLFVSGAVQSTLDGAIHGNSILAEMSTPNRAWVVDMMDKVFQWQVDFSRQVREGDTYRFTLEREVRPDGTLRAGHLISAEYVNEGTAYRAIWFDPNDDGSGTYYDENGKSVRRAFLMKPIPLSRISSRYSNARKHPILNTVRAHRGVDFAAPTGTPIQATSDGVVIYADWKGDLGNLVEIRAPNGWVSRYGHLSKYQQGVRVGTRVKQGQTIGYVGMTGLANGPHCHYELRRNGRALDPLSINLPPGDPVPTSAWGRWALESGERLALLTTMDGPPIERFAEETEPESEKATPEQGGD
ncbi:MAG: M23 family metallopeptidase [Gemmatimonadetes bacterium]|nr:M23 family metallopeptidase [Gemmatimonadota bacterium]NNM04531.1 M23 family metallopeptidase [Gemmatimonadota bacterium]